MKSRIIIYTFDLKRNAANRDPNFLQDAGDRVKYFGSSLQTEAGTLIEAYIKDVERKTDEDCGIETYFTTSFQIHIGRCNNVLCIQLNSVPERSAVYRILRKFAKTHDACVERFETS